jgi:transposase
VAQYEQIVRLHDAGAAIKQIAQTVGVSRETVYRYLSLAAAPERKRPYRTRPVLAPYEQYLRQRWTEGCHNKSQLYRELRSQGYTHGGRNVFRFLKQVEREAETAGRSAPRPSVPSARHVAHLLVQRPERLRVEDQAYLGRLCAQTPVIATAYELAQAFAQMARERQGQNLEAWLAQAWGSGISELRGYARGLEGDRVAVEAGLRQVWSNGQTEGQVNKLKLVKRQMYGRANFDLLRLRVLHAA